jgi:cytochrome P450
MSQIVNTQQLFGGTMMSPLPDPYSVYRRLRDEQPVIPVNSMMGTIYMVTRYDDVAMILRDQKRFSSRGNARGIGVVMGRTLLEMDGVEHVRHRNLIAPFFSPLTMRSSMPPIVDGIVHELIDSFASAGQADLVKQFTFVFPMRVIAQIIGVPIDDYAQFHHMALDLISIGDDPERGLAASQELSSYLAPLLEHRKADPADDLLTKLVHAEIDGHRLTDEEVLSFLRLLLPAGADTTYRLTGNCLYVLLTHDEVRAEIEADREKIELLIQEVLRWESPVQLVSREATANVTLSGHEIPAEAIMSVILGSANRDERRFDNPDRFDLHRKNDDHVGFGFGQHYCAGSHLARLETRTALNAILDRLGGLRLAEGEASRIVGLAFRSPDRLPVVFG